MTSVVWFLVFVILAALFGIWCGQFFASLPPEEGDRWFYLFMGTIGFFIGFLAAFWVKNW